MYNLTGWLYIIKTLLKSRQSKQVLRAALLDNCLAAPRKVYGAYQIDPDKVWGFVISKDHDVQMTMEKLNLSDIYKIMAYYEEIQYKHMRSTYPSKKHKTGF